MSLPNFPDPTAKDAYGKPIYGTHESLLIEYYKQFGVAEAVRKINQFINMQEKIVTDTTKRLNEKQSEY